jgi:uncharacterized protein
MSRYRLSMYSHFPTCEGNKHLVYSASSNGLARLDPDVYELLRKGEDGLDALERDPSKKPILDPLRSGNIIVDKGFDELDFMRLKVNLSRFSGAGLSLTIIPPLDCNLACSYCYEGAKPETYMDETTQDAVVDFAKSQIRRGGYRALVVTWFGGAAATLPRGRWSGRMDHSQSPRLSRAPNLRPTWVAKWAALPRGTA